MTIDEWRNEGERRFGGDVMRWQFVCPSCGHIAAVQDWKDAGASESEVAFSCVGRHMPKAKQMGEKPGPCNYAGGGLFRLNPVQVRFEDGAVMHVFAFAGEPSEPRVADATHDMSRRSGK